ncbi:MAG: hypothetical protein PHI98_02445 [Eubacteriales bacterium]|nr:hypothetical protein [Eubacteriales bacterium]
MRRSGLLSALLLTAALFCAMPGLLRSFESTDANRMDERLRPAETRTLTVWVLGDELKDGGLLSSLCSDFEKEHRGLRVFLRRVTPEELEKEEAVLPELVFFQTGELISPERWFKPILQTEGIDPNALLSGQSGGSLYAVPLWFSPNVLSIPAQWLKDSGAAPAVTEPPSFFGLATSAPEIKPKETLTLETLPWSKLLASGALWIQQGIGAQQMLFVCPDGLENELIAAQSQQSADAKAARAWSLKAHGTAVKAGEALEAVPLLPAVSDQVRYLSFCKDSEDAKKLLTYLVTPAVQAKAQEAGYLAVSGNAPAYSLLQQHLKESYQSGLLFPNAFAHTRQELNALCRDSLLRRVDPVETLLKLR